jgi:hypothetical protein
MPKINPDLYGFRFMTGDVNYLDYGAKWVRLVSGTREYHIIELINWEDSVGEREAKEIGHTYNMSLSIVDLDKLTPENKASALSYIGAENNPDVTDEWLADGCHSYGLRAPIRYVDTSNCHKTFRSLAAYSRELSSNQYVKSGAMRRKVNRIGSTADEFMRGDLNSALVRGIIRDDPTALLLAKIQGYKP